MAETLPLRLLARLVVVIHETEDKELDRWGREILRLALAGVPVSEPPAVDEDLGPPLPFVEALPVAEMPPAAFPDEAAAPPKWKPTPPSKDALPWPDETDEILKSIRWVRRDGREVDLIEPLLRGDHRPLELVWQKLPGERWRGDRALDSKITRLRARMQKASAKLEAAFGAGLDEKPLDIEPEELAAAYEQARQITYDLPAAAEPAGEREAVSVGESVEAPVTARELWDKSVALEKERLADIDKRLRRQREARLGRANIQP
jgi:hypothetical protein